ncbi:DUF1731 domain-containing protein [Tautonia rosea]|uniref:DUF1731 domain-containing protein n=1 Tax=Tautonia rosea TaxID=2728037 RepID=UPI001472DEAA|nr:DUF1731 domain-containing protein [Tautonia rosea]
MTSVEFKWAPLVHSYSNGGAFPAIIDYLADRQRDPRNRETKVGNLTADLAARGYQFQFPELESALKVFDEAGCGSYQRGRPLEQTRLKWSYSAREIAQEVLARVNSVTPDEILDRKEKYKEAEKLGGDTAEPSFDDSMDVYYFPVRRNVVLEVKIRSDMTASETNNLADFVRVIAASRSSGSGGE